MSGWASILSAASALLGTLAGFWATARKRAEENAEMRVQLAGLLDADGGVASGAAAAGGAAGGACGAAEPGRNNRAGA